MAAVGKGHKDAAVGAAGMMCGALAYIKLYPHIKPIIEKGSLGKRTLPELTGTNPWIWVTGLSAATVLAAGLLEGKDSGTRSVRQEEKSG
jgi:hypothetical protein